MSETETINAATFALPAQIVGRLDVAQLVRDAEQLDTELTTARVRAKAGAENAASPKLSERLTDFLVHNQIKLTSSQDCRLLVEQLRQLKEEAPVIHMTFAVTADRESREQLVQWLRTSVHRHALLSVGVQPSLVAGVYLRTPNHILDLSLRARLEKSRQVLQNDLEALRGSR